VGGLEEAGLGLARVGEGTALIAEQLGFEQGLGDGGTVNRDEGAVAARSGLMNRPRQETLAGPGLPEDQDRRQATRAGLTGDQLRDLGPDRDDPRALAL
jgi:hypothetical protein